jgi:hypothetical protein
MTWVPARTVPRLVSFVYGVSSVCGEGGEAKVTDVSRTCVRRPVCQSLEGRVPPVEFPGLAFD